MGKNRIRVLLLAVAAALVVAACGGPPPPSGPSALFDDDALANATVLPTVDPPPALVAALDLTGPTSAAVNRLNADRSGIALPEQGSGPAGPGYVATIERLVDANQATIHRALLYADEDELGDGELIFEGSTTLQSVAVDEAGELMLVSAGSASNGLEAYVFDLAGVFGDAETVYRLSGTSDDEADVAMSLDGNVWVHGSVDDDGMGNAIVYHVDRNSGEVLRLPLDILLGGDRYPMSDTSLSGDGSMAVFVMDATDHPSFGVPIIIGFASTGEGGGILWEGLPGATTALRDPSVTYDGAYLVVEEIFDGFEFISIIETLTDAFDDLFENEEEIVEHPFVTAGADGLVYALDGVIERAEVVFGETGVDLAGAEAVPPSDGDAVGFAPYIARAPPPPPPPPPGTIEYSDTTVGAPTWDRPSPPEPNTFGPVGYHAFEFTADDAGVYTIESEQDYDGFIVLYSDTFDPSEPYTNLVDLNDDQPSAGRSELKVILEPGDYVLVTTGWGPGDEGTFTNRIIPPQELDPTDAPVIELFEADLSVVETGTEIEVTWFATSPTGVTCTIDWGDGTDDTPICEEGTLETAVHAYASEGPKVITLTVTNVNGSDEAKVFPTVHNDDAGSFDIVVVFANDLLSQAQMDAFQDAADRWSEVISGDLSPAQPGDVPPGISCLGEPGFNGEVDDVVISAAGALIDGPGSVLARAGPCIFREPGSNGALEPLPLYGVMQFDVADLDDLETEGGLLSTILHEMGHVLGLGTLWEDNGFIDFAPTTDDCRDTATFTTAPTYTGTQGNAQYVILGGTGGAPIEDEFGAGTKCGHWDEEHFANELMTGFIDVGSDEPLSILTVGALEDLGYTVSLAAADDYTFPPVPARLADEPKARTHDELLFFPKHSIGR